MPSFEYDLTYAQNGVVDLKNYLLGKILFGPVSLPTKSGELPYPNLTPSNLLLSIARMLAHQAGGKLNPAQINQLSQTETDLETLTSKWRVKWEEKVTWEFTSRLRQWTHYLNELAQDLELHSDYYSNEVRSRVQLELLQTAVPQSEEQQAALFTFDIYIKENLTPGEFIWDPALSPGFDPDKYWFLYGELGGK